MDSRHFYSFFPFSAFKMWCFVQPGGLTWSFTNQLVAYPEFSRSKSWTQIAACFFRKVAKHSKSRSRILGAICPTDWEGVGWCRQFFATGWPQVLLVRWLLFFVTRLIRVHPNIWGRFSCYMICTSFIFIKSAQSIKKTYYIYIYKHIIFIYNMLKHFVFCDAHIQSCSQQQSCGYWSGIFGEVFVRGSYSPGIQRKLMSWSQKHLVIPIPTACYRQQLYDTFCLSAVAIIYTFLFVPYHTYHIYLIIIYIPFFHCKVCL